MLDYVFACWNLPTNKNAGLIEFLKYKSQTFLLGFYAQKKFNIKLQTFFLHSNYVATVEPRYNEVSRDRTTYFIIMGVHNKRNPDITKVLKKYEKRHYTGFLITDKILAMTHICSRPSLFDLLLVKTYTNLKQ